jgi:short subunit dehydrogenase-like uncharacterized protein
MSTSGEAREHDLVVFGATGFVGRLVAEHLTTHAPPEARIAIAGRSADRLARLQAALPGAERWKVVVADSGDPGAMAELAASATAVATTVGPYAKYGLPLVEACARAGTHYADLTGEVLFVRESAERCHEAAAGTGARIVHACGYDSIPSDLGVLQLHERAATDGAGGLGRTVLVARARGGISGGTVDSLRTQLLAVAADPAKGPIVEDPYALSPDRSADPDGRDERDPVRCHHDALVGEWLAPFVMGPYNTRIVRRSNALMDHAYGPSFRYQEHMATGTGVAGAALATAVGLGAQAFMAAMSFGPTRAGLDRLLPAPGAGPGEEARRKGWFRSEVYTVTDGGTRYRAVVAGSGDPGYAATAVMFGQSALCLALDGERLPARAGVLTPATAMGGVLVERLRRAGLTLDVTANG